MAQLPPCQTPEVNTLSALHWWIILPASLLLVGLISLGLRVLIERLVGHHRAEAARIAGPLMPALGVLFAFMSGFAITTAWNAQVVAESTVTRESAAATALGWAATAPGADTPAIRSALDAYLTVTVTEEWQQLSTSSPSVTPTTDELAELQRTVRASASSDGVTSPDASAMLSRLDELASTRVARIDAATGSMPLPLFLAIFLTGIAVCLNALVISIDSDSRARLVSASIVVVVAVDLAVLLILSGPFVGSQRVSNAPLVAVREQIHNGQITR